MRKVAYRTKMTARRMTMTINWMSGTGTPTGDTKASSRPTDKALSAAVQQALQLQAKVAKLALARRVVGRSPRPRRCKLKASLPCTLPVSAINRTLMVQMQKRTRRHRYQRAAKVMRLRTAAQSRKLKGRMRNLNKAARGPTRIAHFSRIWSLSNLSRIRSAGIIICSGSLDEPFAR